MVLHFPNKLTEEEQALMVIFINFFKIFNERKWDIESLECVCVCVCLIPVRCVCIPRTESRTRGSSPGTARDRPSAALPPPRCCSPSPAEQNAHQSTINALMHETQFRQTLLFFLFFMKKLRDQGFLNQRISFRGIFLVFEFDDTMSPTCWYLETGNRSLVSSLALYWARDSWR